MTPAARISAAIDLMDRILGGELADRALADWGRKNRYAGSRDRAAIADLVYHVLRRKRSLAALGGDETGRALFLGYLREKGEDPDTVFGAGGYAPDALSEAERHAGRAACDGDGEAMDMPAWLWPEMSAGLGADAVAIAEKMRTRAPVHLRVNLAKASRDQVIAELSDAGITSEPHLLSPSALEVSEEARKIKNTPAYLEGRVELQDGSSQAVADMVPLGTGERLLDFCAGGGGKTLAVAGRVEGKFFAYDINAHRMKDLAHRAERAGVHVRCLTLEEVRTQPLFDTVLVDAPCSGSGSWRRDPQGKWLLNAQALERTVEIQREILDQAAELVRAGGHLVYATCSLLPRENGEQVRDFVRRKAHYALEREQSFTPLEGGDGFYCAVLKNKLYQ